MNDCKTIVVDADGFQQQHQADDRDCMTPCKVLIIRNLHHLCTEHDAGSLEQVISDAFRAYAPVQVRTNLITEL